MNIMSGARLSEGGLHLGHYLGCIQPIENFKMEEYNYFFVIRDRGYQMENIIKLNKYNECLYDIVAELCAIENIYQYKINIVLQSKLIPTLYNLIDNISSIITLKQIINIHPQAEKIKNNNKVNLKLIDFLFPIESITTYLILDAKYIFMNDDNKRFVIFASDILHKINSRYKKNIPAPSLIHGNLPRLLGYNYKKMSKRNNNCIYLTEDNETLQRKIMKLFDFRFLFEINNDFKEHYLAHRLNYNYPFEFLPIVYLRAFGNFDDSKQIHGSIHRNHLFYMLEQVIKNIVQPIKKESKKFRNNPEFLQEKIESGTLNGMQVANKMKKIYDEIFQG